jgi:hypothetical protein
MHYQKTEDEASKNMLATVIFNRKGHFYIREEYFLLLDFVYMLLSKMK